MLGSRNCAEKSHKYNLIINFFPLYYPLFYVELRTPQFNYRDDMLLFILICFFTYFFIIHILHIGIWSKPIQTGTSKFIYFLMTINLNKSEFIYFVYEMKVVKWKKCIICIRVSSIIFFPSIFLFLFFDAKLRRRLLPWRAFLEKIIIKYCCVSYTFVHIWCIFCITHHHFFFVIFFYICTLLLNE